MNPIDAIQFARELITEYNLVGWRVEFDAAVRRFGACHYARKVITLSHHLVKLNDQASVLDTILHEIAHALAGPGSGHGPEWRRVACSIGCSAKRCYSAETIKHPPPRYLVRCKACGLVASRMRIPKRLGACRVCCDRFAAGRFDARFRLLCEPAGQNGS